MSSDLQQNERTFLKEVLSGIQNYRSTYTSDDGLHFRDNEDVALSLQGIIIDAAHFNNAEDTAYDTMLTAFLKSLENHHPEGIVDIVNLLERSIEYVLSWDTIGVERERKS
ncbi:MAG: hypothetical protein WBP22_03245 [Candidatus Saccharimonas sp.]